MLVLLCWPRPVRDEPFQAVAVHAQLVVGWLPTASTQARKHPLPQTELSTSALLPRPPCRTTTPSGWAAPCRTSRPCCSTSCGARCRPLWTHTPARSWCSCPPPAPPVSARSRCLVVPCILQRWCLASCRGGALHPAEAPDQPSVLRRVAACSSDHVADGHLRPCAPQQRRWPSALDLLQVVGCLRRSMRDHPLMPPLLSLQRRWPSTLTRSTLTTRWAARSLWPSCGSRTSTLSV